MDTGSFYRSGSSLTGNLRSHHVLTPPMTPACSDLESPHPVYHPQYQTPDSTSFVMNQKLDHLLSIFTEQKAAMLDSQKMNDELRKEVSALRADVTGLKKRLETHDSERTPTNSRKKIPSDLSVSILNDVWLFHKAMYT